jgi:hypothetical protein
MTRPSLFVVSAVLVMFGIIVGTFVDPVPDRAVSMRGGLRVLEADFHAHTRFSDGVLSPLDLVIQARRRGLDVLGVTEHNMVFPATMARWYSPRIGGPTIVVGEEVTTRAFHVHAIGIEKKIEPRQPLSKIIDDIHAQGGVAIAAHPVKAFWPYFLPVRDKLDGTEVMHPIAYGGRGDATWRWEQMRSFYVEARANGTKLTAIGSSDYHFFSPLGITRTLVFTEHDDAASVLDALKRGRTVVYDLDGGAYGDPEMIALLAREPYTPRAQDYGYRGVSALDRVARALGWLGLVGLLLFAPRRRESEHVLA